MKNQTGRPTIDFKNANETTSGFYVLVSETVKQQLEKTASLKRMSINDYLAMVVTDIASRGRLL